MSDSLFDLNGRVVVVTGGAGQLGRRFLEEVRQRGGTAVSFDLTAAPAVPGLVSYQVDVTDRGGLVGALAALERDHGAPHALVNCAAIDAPPDAPAEENGPFETYPESSFDRVMAANVKGVFLVTQVVGGRMAEAGRGSIVNISSIYGVVSPDQRIYEYRRQKGDPFFKPIAYSASKSALLNMTRYLATYWAPRGVRVNTLTLGGVYNKQDETFVRNYTSHVPLGRMARADDYLGPLVFLLSDASSYMTGANLVVDGGWTAW